MRTIRLLALTIAAIIAFDILVLRGAASTAAPAVIAAIIVSFPCLRDAASPRRRRLLAAAVCVLVTGLAISLSLAVRDFAHLQSAVMTLLLAGAVPLAIWAIILSGRQRRPHGLTHYLDR